MWANLALTVSHLVEQFYGSFLTITTWKLVKMQTLIFQHGITRLANANHEKSFHSSINEKN